MTIVNINSEAIQDVEFHHKKSEFHVTFKDGTDRTYKGVSEKTYSEFLSSESKGRFFNYNIRGVYEEA